MQNTAYFIDFDFTISNGDIWDAIVKRCAPDAWHDIVQAYIRGEINSLQYNQLVSALIEPREPEIRAMVLSMGIDPSFPAFVTWAEARKAPITIVSDGYDYYIELLLNQAGLQHLSCYCNTMVWTEKGIEVKFPLHKEDCEIGMAHCKCQHFEKFPNMRHVYIGDGISDICAATKCAAIYAKRNLREYCIRKEISHFSFDSFTQVLEQEIQQFERWEAESFQANKGST